MITSLCIPSIIGRAERITDLGKQTPHSQGHACFVEVSVLDVLRQRNNPDVRLIEAEKHFTRQNYDRAYEFVKKMLEEDSYNVSVVPLFCAVLTELKKVGELYYLAHKLVSANADSAVAWFSVVSFLAQLTVHFRFGAGFVLLLD